MGKKSSPPPPDYTGAAVAQAQASKENVNMQNYANRPTVNTPWGKESWTTEAVVDPATGQSVTQWTQNTTLTPELQAALDSQIALQQQRSNLAEGFMGRVEDAYSKPFDWENLPSMSQAGPAQLSASIADYSPGLSTDVAQQGVTRGFDYQGPQMQVNDFIGNIQQGVQGTALQEAVNPLLGSLQYGVEQTPLDTRFNPMVNALRRTTGMENVQRQLALGDNPAMPAFDASYRDSIASDLVGRMMPVHQMQQQALETQLANQGFQKGTEAYKRAFDELAGRQASERYNALDIAGNEAQRLYGMQMGQRQQAFNEDVGAGNFANSAANQAFQMGLAGNQFANQATGQAFNQSLAAKQAANQARGQQFNQGVTSAQFGNQAAGQAFNQLLGAGQFFNNAANQRFQQNLAQGDFANRAVNQAFNQSLGAGQFANDAASRAYDMQMGQADLYNRSGNQLFQQDLASQGFRNQALAQAAQMDIQRQQAENAARQAQFQMEMQASEQQNRLRQQAIAEQQLMRAMPLNEMNALLTGQQVGMPQMPGFQTAGVAETPQLLNAANMQYQAALDAQNAKNAAGGNLMSGLFGLGSAAISNQFMFSDRRLKRNIKRVGTHSMGVGIYEYDMAGYRQRGVIAQEVEAVRPDLVRRHASGYLTVNYGELA